MDEQTKNKNKNLLIPSLKADRKMNIVQKRRAFLFSSRKNRGSMTVEASMVLPVFLFFMMTLLMGIEMVRLQSNLFAGLGSSEAIHMEKQIQRALQDQPLLGHFNVDAAEEYLVCAVYAKQLEEHRYGLYSERKRFEVRKYGAAYALGHDSEEKYEVVRMSQCYCRDRSISQKGFGQSVDPYEQNVVSQFDIVFREGVTDEEWNFLVRGKMTSFAGHRVEKQGNGYVLYCHTQKGVFSRDFFYKCPQMKMVVIPDNATLDDGIVVWHSLVPYVHKRMQGRVTVQ